MMNNKLVNVMARKTIVGLDLVFTIIKMLISVFLIYLVLHSGQLVQAAEIDTGVVSGTLGNHSLVQESMRSVFKKTPRSLSDAQLAQQHFASAIKHLSVGEVDKAENNLNLALSYDPHNSQARDLLVSLFAKTGRSQLAIDLLEKENAFERLSFNASLLLANLLANEGNVPAAINVMQHISPEQQDYPGQKDNPQQQELAFQQYYATLAALFYRNAQYDNAQQLYRNLLQQYPNNSVWWLGLGLSLEASDKADAALKAYQQATRGGMANGVVGQFVRQRIEAIHQQLSQLTAGQAG